ncbi:MAG: ammonia channel protein, partial [Rubrivivax sp.]|nr:ammonia channel protein [Rubrivivax sp.]
MKKLIAILALATLATLALGLGGSAFAQDTAASAAQAASAVVEAASAPEAAPAAAEAASAAEVAPTPTPTVHKGDVAWMMTATLLVVFMAVPGLALFYGGLVRSKNMLSVLMQVMVVFSLICVLWAVYGYSLAFGGEGLIIAGLDKVFLLGVTKASLADTFTA